MDLLDSPVASLPHGEHINGLTMHVLEADFEHTAKGNAKSRFLLLHGFPELAYSWRKVMLSLAQACVAFIAMQCIAPSSCNCSWICHGPRLRQ